jgi:hypothetical protein
LKSKVIHYFSGIGFAEAPDTGFGEKQGGKTTKNPL